jgi:hypothetical protein
MEKPTDVPSLALRRDADSKNEAMAEDESRLSMIGRPSR